MVRTDAPPAEEIPILDQLGRRLADEGIELVSVYLGSGSYEAERPGGSTAPRGPRWVLAEDAAGRGLAVPPDDAVRVLTPEELMVEIMAAERVVSMS